MSLCINMPKVTRVLLADGWHQCRHGISLDSYEIGVYVWDSEWGNGAPRFRTDTGHAGGERGICSTGVVFTDEATGEQIAAPLTSVLALAGPGMCSSPERDDPDVEGRPMAQPVTRPGR